VNKEEAKSKIAEILGHDLIALARHYNVTVFKNGKKNKGWVGHIIEAHLGLPINSLQSPDFIDWELKSVSLKLNNTGNIQVKETMAITMINPEHVLRTPFESSHLFAKMNNMLIVTRVWHNVEETASELHSIHDFNLQDKSTYEQVKADYELVQQTLKSEGFTALTGKMGKYIQPRTKGAGHGSISRAFYARVPFLTTILLR